MQTEIVIFVLIMHLDQNPTGHYDEIIFLYPQLKLAELEQNSMIFNSYLCIKSIQLTPCVSPLKLHLFMREWLNLMTRLHGRYTVLLQLSPYNSELKNVYLRTEGGEVGNSRTTPSFTSFTGQHDNSSMTMPQFSRTRMNPFSTVNTTSCQHRYTRVPTVY